MNVDYLFDNTKPFDEKKVQILDKVMAAMHSGNGQQISQASVVLSKLQNDFNFWQNTHAIMMNSKNSQTKFFSLMILKDTMKSRWNIIDEKVKSDLRAFILKVIAQIAMVNDSNDKAVLTKANELLIEIIKNEWGKTWNTAIQDLTTSAKTNQNVCYNNLKILKMLSEDIFDFSKNQLTSNQVEDLKQKFEKEFTSIYELCDMIIKTFITNNKSFKVQLVKECLSTLQAFLSWMPIQYIFMTDLPELLLKLMEQEYLTTDAVKCLTDIISIDIKSICGSNEQAFQKCKMKILEIYNSFSEKLQKLLPRTQNLKSQRSLLVNSKNYNKIVMFDNSVKCFVGFFTGLFETHYDWILEFVLSAEKMHRLKICQIMDVTLYYMAIISEIEEDTIFKNTIVFWEIFLLKYAKTYPCGKEKSKMSNFNGQVLNLGGKTNKDQVKTIYESIFTDQTKAVIMNSLVNQMPKPEEVKFELDESGLPKTVKIDNTSHSDHYRKTKNCLCSIAKCHFMNLRGILDHHVNSMMSFTNFNKLNKLCWAIGTISGVGSKQNEKSMIILVLRNLLSLTQRLQKIDEKSTVASNILYIVCKYPKFLKGSFEFMICVFNKVFEFMKNKFDGVKKMAVDTFKILCEKVGSRLMTVEKGPDESSQNPGFSDQSWDILSDLQQKTDKLQLSHKITFYEGIGNLLGSIKDGKILTHCIQYTLTPLMKSWKNLIGNAGNNTDYLGNDETCTNISFFMRVNERMSSTIGKRYFKVFDHIFNDIIVLYKFYSDQITASMKNSDENQRSNFLKSYGYKRMKGVRGDILNLFATFIKTADPQVAKVKYLQGFGQLLQSYREEMNETKEPNLLLLYGEILNTMSEQVGDDAQFLLNGLFDSTLPMITNDFKSYPDHRLNFFIFLKFAVKNCFNYLIKIKPNQFKVLIDCLLWSIKHELSTIFVIGLDTIQILLNRVCQANHLANGFFKRHYFTLLHEIIVVLTDKLHKNGFDQQKEILRMLLGALDVVTQPLVLDQKGDNKQSVGLKIVELMSKNFPNLKPEDHQTCISRLFNSYQDPKHFGVALEDYLVVLNIFTNTQFNV